MKIITTVDLTVIRQHEQSCRANVTLGGYGMTTHSPTKEFQLYKAVLETDDSSKLFLLNCGFASNTHGQTGRLADIRPETMSDISKDRVNSFTGNSTKYGEPTVQLQHAPQLALLMVCDDPKYGPWIIIDGNHRAISQYISYGNLHDISAYLCVHPQIRKWAYIPSHIRI